MANKRDWRGVLTPTERESLALLDAQIKMVVDALITMKRKRANILAGQPATRATRESSAPVKALTIEIQDLTARKRGLLMERHMIRNRASVRAGAKVAA